jgi:hypothetical protein
MCGWFPHLIKIPVSKYEIKTKIPVLFKEYDISSSDNLWWYWIMVETTFEEHILKAFFHHLFHYEQWFNLILNNIKCSSIIYNFVSTQSIMKNRSMLLLAYRSSCFSSDGLSSSKMWRLSQNKRQRSVTLFCTAMKTMVGFSFSKLDLSGVTLEAAYLSGTHSLTPCTPNRRTVAWSTCLKNDGARHTCQRSYEAWKENITVSCCAVSLIGTA